MKVMDMQFQEILEKAENGQPLSRKDCGYLLRLDEKSFEAGLLRTTAASIIRKKNENSAIILGQIGIDIKPCPGGCRFCTFGEKHTHFHRVQMSEEELAKEIEAFCHYGDLYGLYLMTMHDYDMDYFLKCVELARKIAPSTTQIWANVGDTSLAGFKNCVMQGLQGCTMYADCGKELTLI